MAIEVESQDCTAVTDAQLDEMAGLGAEGPNPFAVGVLSKQTEEWVLVGEARENGKLKGYSFSTLERIGGTPSVLIGPGSVIRNSKRDTVLRAMMAEHYKRALMAFPDEDVLVGLQLNDPSGLEAFKMLDDLIPRPDHRANGEERAWGKRLAKRFGISASSYDERSFVARGDGSPALVLDHESLKPEKLDPAMAEFFAPLDTANGDTLITYGWATAETLLKFG